MRNLLNAEGYADPTATTAILKVSLEESEADRRACELIKVLKYVTHTAGFELFDRIQLKDTKTGRIYK